MKAALLFPSLCLALLGAPALHAAGESGFVPLFNGRDLTGWVNVNCAPETWTVRDGMIHCTGHPTGAMRTRRQYENFILELEWRHLSSGGNSGVFIWGTPVAAPGVPFLRGIEVQVLDHGFNIPGKNQWYTTHGDVFPIHGASMSPFGRHNGDRSFPSEERSKGTPEWNHYRVACTNGVLRLHVNGREVSGGEHCNYRKGYLALESEGGPVEFRNLRIKELPSSGAPASLTAPVDLGWKSLFTGLDLRGWRTNATTAPRWAASGERLVQRSGTADPAAILWTEAEYSDVELLLDVHAGKSPEGRPAPPPTLVLRGRNGAGFEVPLEGAGPEGWHRFSVTAHGRTLTLVRDGGPPQSIPIPRDLPRRGAIGLHDSGAPREFMNLYVRSL